MVQKLLVIALLLAGNPAAANAKPAEARNEDVPKGPAVPQTNTNPQGGKQSPTGSVGSPNKGIDAKSTPSGGATGGGGKGSAPAK